MNIYAGNLSFEVTDDDLKEAFAFFGEVVSAKIIKDQFSGRSKGFGFVEMSDSEAAKAAIEALDGKEIKGRTIKVNESKPRKGGGGGRGRQGGGGRFNRGASKRNY